MLIITMTKTLNVNQKTYSSLSELRLKMQLKEAGIVTFDDVILELLKGGVKK